MESDSPGWCRHSFTSPANATAPYDPAKPSSGAQHSGELSGTGGYRINFYPDVGIYCSNLYRIFILLGRAWDGHKGVLPWLLKLQEAKLFSAHGCSTEGQGRGTAGTTFHALLSTAALRGQCFAFPMRISCAPRLL